MRVIFSIAIGIGAAFTALSTHAQTLFTYGPNEVSKEEFLRVYQKNNAQKKPDFSSKAVKEYLDLYSLFRMKVKEAESMKLDTTSALIAELNNYKGQLARTYLSDKEVTKGLVKQAYDRMKEEVKVAHILVSVKPNDDTVQAYRKIDSIYNEVAGNKADFAEMAKRYSEDKGSAANGGEIGYITALQVVFPVENAAYETPVGKVSAPFRSQFGYHIVKVEDRRKSQGQVQLQQIMIGTPKSKGAEGVTQAEATIEELKAKLKKGASFDKLAEEYSDDKFSKSKGGMMEPFGVGKYTPAFESAAFALKKPGDIAGPIETEYGVHLIRLVKKIPLQPFDSIKDNLTRRVENDSRATLAKEAYQNKIKNQFGFKDHSENLPAVINAMPADTVKEKVFNADDFKNYTAVLFEVGGKKYTQYDFVQYASGITRGKIIGSRETAVRDLYKMYQNAILNDLQQEDLEKNNTEFKNLITEYRDGILLFDLMDKNVWSKASRDTIGLAEFYEQNKSKYNWQPGFDGTVYQSGSEVDLEKLHTRLNSGADATEALKEINDVADNKSRISQQSGRFEFSRFPVDKSNFAEGKATKVFKNEDGTFSAVFVAKVYNEVMPKTLDEARGFVVADYQDYLEKKWNAELRAKYPLKVDEKVMKGIVK